MAFFIERVMTSAYMMTLPSRWRAARPMTWISDPSERRKPSLSAARIATSETSAQQVDAHNYVIDTQAQVAQNFDALDGIDLRVQIVDFDAQLLHVIGQVFAHLLGQR